MNAESLGNGLSGADADVQRALDSVDAPPIGYQAFAPAALLRGLDGGTAPAGDEAARFPLLAAVFGAGAMPVDSDAQPPSAAVGPVAVGASEASAWLTARFVGAAQRGLSGLAARQDVRSGKVAPAAGSGLATVFAILSGSKAAPSPATRPNGLQALLARL